MQRFNFQSLRIASFFALGFVALAAAPLACGSTAETPGKPANGTTSSSSGGSCVGGIVEDGGVCAAKCDPTKCVGADAGVNGDTCVDNECKLRCDTHLDCQTDQHCVAKTADYMLDPNGAVVDAGGSNAVLVCESSGKSGGFGTACPLGKECDTLFACPDGTPCDPMGGDAGGTCAAAECKALVCRSSGLGDAESFCTMNDCHMDTDCPDGFECGVVRDPHLICNKMPPKPSSGGKTPCVDPSTYTQNGQTFQEGPASLLRNVCIKRKQCAPCKIDLDCSEVASADPNGELIPIQQCIMIGGEGHCARQCAVDKDCSGDYKCDTGHCVPRFGACKGTGKFCEPCQNDLECGGTATNNKVCGGLFADQKACIDSSLPDTCTTTNDCPLAPDGKHHGVCLDEVEQVMIGDPSYHHCYYPYNAGTNKFSCW